MFELFVIALLLGVAAGYCSASTAIWTIVAIILVPWAIMLMVALTHKE